MIGKIINLFRDITSKTIITLEIDEDVAELLEELKEYKVTIDIKKYRKKRNLDQNAYFHTLCNKLAQVLHVSNNEMKINLNLDYGTLERIDGKIAGCKVPRNVNMNEYYKYAKKYKEDSDGDCYIFYKRTRDLDTKEFARLLEGTIEECKLQGIETMTPEQIFKEFGLKINEK